MKRLSLFIAVVLVASVVLPTAAVRAQDDELASISGQTWEDVDGDGVRSPEEPAVAGVVVFARDAAGAAVGSAITDLNGAYSIATLAAGDYQMQFVPPLGREFTIQDAGDDSIDSDADPATGTTAPYTLEPPNDLTSIDAGLLPEQVSSVGDFVWIDENQDGLQGADEPGLAGVVVQSYSFAGDLRGETVTDALGNYRIGDLPGGNYVIRFILPDGYRFTAANVGDDDSIDSDAATGIVPQVQVPWGAMIDDVDVGVLPPLPIVEGIAFADLNENGLQDDGGIGVPGINVQLYTPNGLANFATTDADGRYEMTVAEPGEYWVRFSNILRSLVTEQDVGDDDSIDSDIDADGRTPRFTVTGDDRIAGTFDAGVLQPRSSLGGVFFLDENRNGVRDATESSPIRGTARAFDSTGSSAGIFRSFEDGSWLIENLRSGEYRVEFSLPGALEFTLQDQGDDDLVDSDADPVTGLTDVYTVAPAQALDGIDAGALPVVDPGSIGGIVFFDPDADGIRAAEYQTVRQVLVEVFDSDDRGVGNASTDFDGAWRVADLPAGDYTVKFTPRFFEADFSPQDQGDDDSIDSDPDAATGVTGLISLAPSEDLIGVDAGILVTDSVVGSVGDFVFEDLNENGFQDIGEPGFEGVVLDLLNRFDSVVLTTVSDAAGAYVFSDVIPGLYTIRVDLPDGRVFTTNIMHPFGGTDSDVDPATGVIPTFELRPGEGIPTLDVGVLPLVSDDLLGDVNCDGVSDVIDALFVSLFTVDVRTGVQSCGTFDPTEKVIAVRSGDVDASGETNIIDALLIAQCDAGLTNVFCPEP